MSQTNSARLNVRALRDIERRLSEPRFDGIPIGPALGNLLTTGFGYRRLDRSLKSWLIQLAVHCRYRTFPVRVERPLSLEDLGGTARIFVTCSSSNFRLTDLVFPVVRELGVGRCLILFPRVDVLPQLPAGASGVRWSQVISCSRREWAPKFRRWWPQFRRHLRTVCEEHSLGRCGYLALANNAMIATQYVIGCRELLRRCGPSAIVTDCDRHDPWQCLILIAKDMGIPTFGLIHGVLNDGAMGMVPLLADLTFTWGDLDRGNFIKAGEDSAGLEVGGCPRLEQGLQTDPVTAKAKLGLSMQQQAVMLGTDPISQAEAQCFAEIFCRAMGLLPDVEAFVRLHPSQTLNEYAALIRTYPAVRFFENSTASLDEALAAADVVVVGDTGLGSDALVKGRLAVVLSPVRAPAGHDLDLATHAECPVVSNADELARVLRALFTDPAYRQRLDAAAARFVPFFCRRFGRDAARHIAGRILDRLHTPLEQPKN
jgi:hypothetical protein